MDNSEETAEQEYRQGLEKIKERCAKANITCFDSTHPFEEDIPALTINIPAGKETRSVEIMVTEDVEALLETPFEEYIFIEGYDSIAHYQSGTIHATLRLAPGMEIRDAVKRIFKKDVPYGIRDHNIRVQENDALILTNEPTSSGFRIILGPWPGILSAFSLWAHVRAFCLTIHGPKINKNSEAIDILEKVANSLFFQLDNLCGVALRLNKEQTTSSRTRNPRSEKTLTFPNLQYDARPMSLYWYGRVSQGTPLLQFLAFYQAIEFFFPTFSEKDAISKVRTALKHPNFDLHDDSHVEKILRSIKPSVRGFGNEIQQLEATIRACVDPKELRHFLSEDSDRKKFYESNDKSVAQKQIPLRNENSDLLKETAERVYEIRCRIVHTKDSDPANEKPPLLPFSRESEKLEFDIELVEFLSKWILVATSRSLKL